MKRSENYIAIIKNKLIRKSILFYVTGAILLSIVSTELVLYSQNNLLQNNQWIAVKRMPLFNIIGADDFLLSRSVLSKNQINLSKFWGYQSIRSKKVFDFAEGSFQFEVSPTSYLDLFFHTKQSQRIGLRLNRRPTGKSFTFTATEDHLFLSKDNVDFELNDGWNEIRFIFSEDKILFILNGKKSISLKIQGPVLSTINLQSGFKGAKVDDIQILEKSGSRFYESFRFKSDKRLFVFLVNFLLFLVLTETFFFLGKLAIKNLNSGFRKVFITNFFFLCVFLFSFDFLIWSKGEHYNHTKALFGKDTLWTNPIEGMRFRLFRSYAKSLELIEDEKKLYASNGYPLEVIWKGPIFCSADNPCHQTNFFDDNKFKEFLKKSQECSRLVFIGTSQTIGSGASSIDKTFFKKIHDGLNQINSQKCLISINLSVSGADSNSLLEINHKLINAFRPHFAFINLAHNDYLNTFQKYLNKLIEFNKSTGVTSILIKEPNSPYSQNDELKEKHLIMDEIAKHNNLNIIDLHSKLKTLNQKELGTLWWDKVHLSNLGHHYVAQIILSELSNFTDLSLINNP